ncbi:MAG: ParB/RepB/Spo0J family partition protein [Oscillospiraceae bacterium]|jgi:ParB family chromosome partitioning protein|nr:ParB/RepB/Spo0J family partition protein [Oscillospiraceae bacterium]
MLGKRQQTVKQNLVLDLRPDEIIPNPNQPRRVFDAADLSSLAESIKQNGIIQPLSVRARKAGGYELIAGERRLRAAKLVGLPTVPCVLSEVTDEHSAVIALVENIQREDLSFFEEAEAIQRTMETYRLPQETMAKRLGRAQSTLSNKLRLLKLPMEIREIIRNADLTERHARALLRIEDPVQQRNALDLIVMRELNVSETDRLITSLLETSKKSNRQTVFLSKDVRLFVNTINHAVDAMVKIGIPADCAREETDDMICFTVRIPKSAALKNGGKARESVPAEVPVGTPELVTDSSDAPAEAVLMPEVVTIA